MPGWLQIVIILVVFYFFVGPVCRAVAHGVMAFVGLGYFLYLWASGSQLDIGRG